LNIFIAAIQTPANQAVDHNQEWLQNVIHGVIQIAVGVVIGWVAHRFSRLRDDRNRARKSKDNFGVFIHKLASLLPQVKVQVFYILTKPSINSEIHGLWHFLTDDKRARLDRLWKEYDEIPDADLSEDRENEYGTTWEEGLVEAVGGIPSNSKHPRIILKYYLDEFYKFSA
jgi:hypothetical protein